MSDNPYQNPETLQQWQDEQRQHEIDRVAESALYAMLANRAISTGILGEYLGEVAENKRNRAVEYAFFYAEGFINERERRRGQGSDIEH